MREDKKMNAHVTKSGYKYYTPHQASSRESQAPQVNKWKKGGKWIGKVFLKGLKHLPDLLIKVAITPIFLLLFVLNLLKCLLATAIGWFVFKVIVGFVVIGYWAFLTKEGAPPASVETWFHDWIMPEGVPIHHWWETTIIVVLAIITALSLTLHPSEA